ncbi:Phosphoglycerate mutase [Desulfobulbus propionicus DSM 2032]|uniref:Phosphoglycerate mutase n=1 Tax=Desulfobulbus propionicus (strain ATCC 33891 / DSM 2032 / VKM B-1956 / 1pr3) TaxID=577650 RepID=A0A7U3YLW3_DESPD|nr:histidine phosphatase family protein [Desulfobulbus propionicus]ADW17779.1 Phosphoglycerate mutase [Desulfobulbus propionicus DSM 2032]
MQSLIVLARHGAIDTSSPRRFLGQTDLPLNAEGIRQARMVGERLRALTFSHIFSSPLQRALHTAALAGNRPLAEIQSMAALTEINLGDWEGLSVAEVQARYPGAYEQRGQDLEHFRPPGGESFADLAARALPALRALADEHPGPLLVVAHAGVNRVILSRLLDRPLCTLFALPQDHCAVNLLRRGSHGLRVEAINLRLLTR